jgi:hypothetical protein
MISVVQCDMHFCRKEAVVECFGFMLIVRTKSADVHLVFAPKSPFHEKVTKYFPESFRCDGPSAFYSDSQSKDEM